MRKKCLYAHHSYSVQIEEQVPIQVCTTVDPNREAVTTNVGDTYRSSTESYIKL